MTTESKLAETKIELKTYDINDIIEESTIANPAYKISNTEIFFSGRVHRVSGAVTLPRIFWKDALIPSPEDSDSLEYTPEMTKDQYLICPGVHILISGAAGGKTTIARFLAKQYNLDFYKMGEPGDSVMGSWLSLISIIEGTNDRNLLIDSLKFAVDTQIGATGTGGVDRGILEFLTCFSILAKARGLVYIFTINPQLPEEQLQNWITFIQGAVDQVFKIDDGRLKASIRYGDRDWRAIDLPQDISIKLNNTIDVSRNRNQYRSIEIPSMFEGVKAEAGPKPTTKYLNLETPEKDFDGEI